ncbi:MULTISPECIES: DUF3082 domain-containing protein [unclassified Prochlorococcus]|uniref:DUF3082 domain-containing protein n=1 Tax=unclassified Prochlorococcus TaxID=2627481 RepID=UPI0005337F24|nr:MULTISPECIES: DUF3082 domain-containing protein [unclassified Prochlorococcus]KGG17351.1 hypothetical protein EV07_0789 [Prochlorococcus sp. MIT 0603]
MKGEDEIIQLKKKGPLSFLSGALTSVFFAWLSFLVSRNIVVYFTVHSPHYSSPIAQSIASALKTLIIGMSFLATFTFSFIGLGLAIVFIRSLFYDKPLEDD